MALTTTEVQADISGAVSLEQELKRKNKDQLIQYADQQMGLQIDQNLDEDVIRRELMKYGGMQRNLAREESEKAAKASTSKEDPLINVVFRNLQSVNEDITFNFAGPKGVYGKAFKGPGGKALGNPTGHKMIPKYHLYPGMEIELPYSVIEHLRSRTFTRHIPLYDNATGMISGVTPVITPRFILEQRLTKEQAIALQNMKRQ